jgi:hypothetical protein
MTRAEPAAFYSPLRRDPMQAMEYGEKKKEKERKL